MKLWEDFERLTLVAFERVGRLVGSCPVVCRVRHTYCTELAYIGISITR